MMHDRLCPDIRLQAVEMARDWIGTPYVHQASAIGAGCDCLGLVRGVWRGLYGPNEPEAPPNYTPDWAEARGEETLLAACRRWLVPVETPAPGDVLVFRLRPGVPCKHVGILSDENRFIHAYWGRSVVEGWLRPVWSARIAAAFAFPPLTFEDDDT
ncbi:MAG: NlpC/P60 family protein [Pseudomonadota bacterium]